MARGRSRWLACLCFAAGLWTTPNKTPAAFLGVSPRPLPRRRTHLMARGGDGGAWPSRPAVPELEQQTAPTPPAERVPWDWQRFFTQASRFVSFPSLLPPPAAAPARPQQSLGAVELFPLDDVVMGGASESSFDNKLRRWAGTVTSANSGGFVGVRTKAFSPAIDASGVKGLSLRIRGGDGLRFKFILRDSTDFNGIAWSASFDTRPSWTNVVAGEEQVVQISFDELIPTIFARTVPNAKFNRENIVSVQFALSKFEYDGGLNPNFREGNFQLDVLDIAFF